MNTQLVNSIIQLISALPADEQQFVIATLNRYFPASTIPIPAETENPSFIHFFGVLKDSSNFNEDPVTLQRSMRNEWD